ncbi:MAG: hypothetical protein LBE86_00085 [Gemmobacter sp.]|jgi:hypothetical protein|nr:hypothetical protein [Gemmobacter sp.]
MGAASIQQMADRVADLMEDRLRIGGAGLAAKLDRGGSRLPRKVRTAAGKLAEAAHMSQNPRLLPRIDQADMAENYRICLRHLSPLGWGARQRGRFMSVAAQVAFGLIAVVAAFLLMHGRGLI